MTSSASSGGGAPVPVDQAGLNKQRCVAKIHDALHQNSAWLMIPKDGPDAMAWVRLPHHGDEAMDPDKAQFLQPVAQPAFARNVEAHELAAARPQPLGDQALGAVLSGATTGPTT
jgi:hypothetical protein